MLMKNSENAFRVFCNKFDISGYCNSYDAVNLQQFFNPLLLTILPYFRFVQYMESSIVQYKSTPSTFLLWYSIIRPIQRHSI